MAFEQFAAFVESSSDKPEGCFDYQNTISIRVLTRKRPNLTIFIGVLRKHIHTYIKGKVIRITLPEIKTPFLAKNFRPHMNHLLLKLFRKRTFVLHNSFELYYCSFLSRYSLYIFRAFSMVSSSNSSFLF